MIGIKIPLADRMRPDNLDDFWGQEGIIGPGKLLRLAIENDNLPSMIFWGPPGTGKTTLAHIIAQKSKAGFLKLSAVSSGKKDFLDLLGKTEVGEKTILFIDEIHRWNKAQQDALLPVVESGRIILIGATTENPSFEVRGALLSRCRVFVLQSLSAEHIKKILNKAIKDEEKGLGRLKLKVGDEVLDFLAQASHGDARTALNILEYASLLSQNIGQDLIKEALQKSHLLYDATGDEYYNLISALHKSMRGGDANASLYWLFRMLEAGEEPLKIARRILRFASEDVGLANSRALEQAVAAYQACHFVGMPECNVILAQAVVYMAKCPKSNELYRACNSIKKDIEKYGNLPVPLHLRNAPTKLMKDLNYGRDYKYSPEHNYKEKQDYLPPEILGKAYLK